jgi:hypothetical protein
MESNVQQKKGETIKENGKPQYPMKTATMKTTTTMTEKKDDDDINDDTKRTSERQSPDPKVQQTVFGSVKVK